MKEMTEITDELSTLRKLPIKHHHVVCVPIAIITKDVKRLSINR